MRSDEHNWHVHGSYAEETAPSSNVNVTEKEKVILTYSSVVEIYWINVALCINGR